MRKRILVIVLLFMIAIILYLFLARTPTYNITVKGAKAFDLLVVDVDRGEKFTKELAKNHSLNLKEGSYQFWTTSTDGTSIYEEYINDKKTIDVMIGSSLYINKTSLLGEGEVFFNKNKPITYLPNSFDIFTANPTLPEDRHSILSDPGVTTAATQTGNGDVIYYYDSVSSIPGIYSLTSGRLTNQLSDKTSHASKLIGLTDVGSSGFYIIQNGKLFFYSLLQSKPVLVEVPESLAGLVRVYGNKSVLFYSSRASNTNSSDTVNEKKKLIKILSHNGDIIDVNIAGVITGIAVKDGYLVSTDDGVYSINNNGEAKRVSSLKPTQLDSANDVYLFTIDSGLYIFNPTSHTSRKVTDPGINISSITAVNDTVEGSAFDSGGRFSFTLTDKESTLSQNLPHSESDFDINYLDEPKTIIIKTHSQPVFSTALNSGAGDVFKFRQEELETKALKYLNDVGIDTSSYSLVINGVIRQ